MKTKKMSNPTQITNRLQELSTFIEKARDKLQTGEVVDLAHLDDEVSQLCAATLGLKAEDAIQVQPVMADMISKLEEMGIALKDFQNNFKPTGGTQ